MRNALRNYQIEFVSAIRQKLNDGFNSVCCVAPTGSGKTVVFCHIAANAIEKGKSVLILTHRQEILEQTISKLFAFGITPGQIISGRTMTKNPVQVGMISTLVNRLGSIPDFDLIIIDEAHHMPAKTWMTVNDHFRHNKKLHFTATPERLDGQGMSGICDSMVLCRDILWLVCNGYLVVPVIKPPPHKYFLDYHMTRGDYDVTEQEAYMSNRLIIGDVIDHYRQYLDRKPAICFVPTIKYGLKLEQDLRNARIGAKLVQGGQKYMAERKAAIKGLTNGNTEILLSRDVVAEGVDVPSVSGILMLRKTASLTIDLQQAGRGLRLPPINEQAMLTKESRLKAIRQSEKPCCYILDFVGNYYQHGHILEPRDWSLQGHKRNPKQKADFIECPRCRAPWPRSIRVCLDCGYEFSKKERARRSAKFEHIQDSLVDALPGVDSHDLERLAEIMSKPRKQSFDDLHSQIITEAGEIKTKIDLLKKTAYDQGLLNWAWEESKKLHNK
jgi:superfamily II DNA or RNA helicase